MSESFDSSDSSSSASSMDSSDSSSSASPVESTTNSINNGENALSNGSTTSTAKSGDVIKSATADIPASTIQNVPIGLVVCIFIILIFCAIAGLKSPPFSNGGKFMITQFTINFTLIILLSFGYGLFCIVFGKGVTDPSQSTNILIKYQHLFLPIILIVVIWLKNYMVYRMGIVNYCAAKNAASGVRAESSYRWETLLWNTSKVPIAIFVTYLFVLLCPWTLMPFFQLFDSAHMLVFFFGVGFWAGCASWASEASCYFEMMRYGCAPAENVNFKSIEATIEEAEAAEAK